MGLHPLGGKGGVEAPLAGTQPGVCRPPPGHSQEVPLRLPFKDVDPSIIFRNEVEATKALHQNEALQERENRFIRFADKPRDTRRLLFLVWPYRGTWFLDWGFARVRDCYSRRYFVLALDCSTLKI